MAGVRRRLVFRQVRKAEWEELDLPTPDQLGPSEVLLRTACTLVSAGTETANYAGTHINFSQPGRRAPLPFRPGYAYAGTVEAVGREVTTLRPGDRLAASSGHADWAVVDTRRTPMVRLPDGVTFEQGCLARLALIAMQGVRLARIRLGDRVVVFGQGLIGQFARQLAKIDGAGVAIGVDVIDGRLAVARRHGASLTINPATAPVVEAVKEATDGRGADVAIEATGNPSVINDALKVAADLGRVVLLGSPRGRIEIDPYTDIHYKGVSVIGAHARTTANPPNAYNPWTMSEHYRLAVQLIGDGRLQTDGLVTDRVPADEALTVHEALVQRPQDHLGVVIQWRKTD
jgi:2-desacetyl-2-hydroxyethyl bacteriochlorophyllide A dehydrogenase